MVKILYIEDNKSLSKLFTLIATDHNFISLTCDNPKQAFNIAKTENPDVILLDIHLNEYYGFNFIAELKTDTCLFHIPVIGCSVTFDKLGEKIILLGGTKFVNEKPSSIEKLNLILEGVLPPIP